MPGGPGGESGQRDIEHLVHLVWDLTFGASNGQDRPREVRRIDCQNPVHLCAVDHGFGKLFSNPRKTILGFGSV